MKNNSHIKLYATENGIFEFDCSVTCIISSIRGFMPSQGFRGYMEKGLELIREKINEHGKLGWIPELTTAEIFDPCDTE